MAPLEVLGAGAPNALPNKPPSAPEMTLREIVGGVHNPNLQIKQTFLECYLQYNVDEQY